MLSGRNGRVVSGYPKRITSLYDRQQHGTRFKPNRIILKNEQN